MSYWYGPIGYHEGDPLPGDVAVLQRPDPAYDFTNGAWVLNQARYAAEVEKSYGAAAQAALDAVALVWGYNSIESAATYLTSANAKYKAEAAALVAWRDATWTASDTLQGQVLGGTAQMPATAAAFVAAVVPPTPTRPT